MQLAYGDDGLDPLLMEGASAGQALNLERLMSVVRSRAGAPPPLMALPDELRAAASEALEHAGTALAPTFSRVPLISLLHSSHLWQ